MINGDFKANAPNKKWLGDLTEIPCKNGKLYMSAVLDCFDGCIVGLSVEDNMRKEMVVDSLHRAFDCYGASNLIFHSDQGSQYTSDLFRQLLDSYNCIPSMSGVRRCFDNARMESFFATLKKEKLYRINTKHLPKSKVKSLVYRFVAYYNNIRITTMNPEGLAPLVYREKYYSQNLMAA